MRTYPEADLASLFARLYDVWSPLKGEWFALARCAALCYVQRSPAEGSAVVAPAPGLQPAAFPEEQPRAGRRLEGLFTATPTGDVFVREARYKGRGAGGRGSEGAFWPSPLLEVLLEIF